MNNFPEVWTSLFNATVVFTSIHQRNMNMTGWKNRQTFIVSQQDICVQQDWEVLGASVTWLALARQPTPSNPQKAIHIETWPPCCQHVWDVKAECQVDLTHSHPCWMVDLNCLVLKSIETWDTFSVAKKNPHDFPIDCEFPMIFMDFPCLMVSFVANSPILRCQLRGSPPVSWRQPGHMPPVREACWPPPPLRPQRIPMDLSIGSFCSENCCENNPGHPRSSLKRSAVLQKYWSSGCNSRMLGRRLILGEDFWQRPCEVLLVDPRIYEAFTTFSHGFRCCFRPHFLIFSPWKWPSTDRPI